MIAGAIILFLALNFVLRPYLYQRSAVKLVLRVLDAWNNGDLTNAYHAWEEPQQAPPVYNLTSYELLQKNFYQDQGTRHAEILTDLQFPDDNITPSGEWIFHLKETRGGWKVVDFYQSPAI